MEQSKTYLKAFKFRIYPKGDQVTHLANNFGCCRYVFNKVLELRQKAFKEEGKSLSYFDTTKILPVLKRQEETKWLGKAMSQPLQMAAKNVDSAFKNFFGKKAKYPKFKCKNSRQCIKIQQGFRVEEDLLYIPKLKTGIKINLSREIKGKILYLHISKSTTGKYYASFTCEVPREQYDKTGNAVGVDVGIKESCILSSGKKYANIHALKKLENKVKYEQRRLSKKQKGSNSSRKQRLKIARLHERIRQLRETCLHNISSDIIKNNDIIITEDLSVKNLMQNHCIAKALSDASLGKLLTQLEYKSEWYGRTFAKVDRFFPSSKTCSACGAIKQDLKLSDRNWTCTTCHHQHDRDVNAAINILNEGLKKLSGLVTKPDIKQKWDEASSLEESENPDA
jgi:putative transposase